MTNEILDFLQECSKEMYENYDNSVNIPEDVHLKYMKVGKIINEWKSYIKYKFRYLILLENEPERADEKILKELSEDNKKYLTDFILIWKEREEKEKIVYLYRASQLPRDIVEDTWYQKSVPECNSWCNLRWSELTTIDNLVNKNEWVQTFVEIYNQIGDQPSIDCRKDILLSEISKKALKGITARVNFIQQYLEKTPKNLSEIPTQTTEDIQAIIHDVGRCFNCLKDNPSNEVPEINSFLENDLLVELSMNLIKTLHTSGFDEMMVLRKFLEIIKNKLNCEVCDFLDVTEEKKVIFKTATVNHEELSDYYKSLEEEELRQAIIERESYGKGVGISGSIGLIQDDSNRNIWWHIGSNDVKNDPRQSEEHSSAYEIDMYPDVLRCNHLINNFWMFPIFENGNLIGAFRVVNKLNRNGGLQAGGWPYYTRVQLALIAKWLSRFLETVRKQLQEKEDFAAFNERNEQIQKMIEKLQLNWIEKKPLQALIRHISNDISKRYEKRAVGCCILVIDKNYSLPPKELSLYPMIDSSTHEIEEPYDGLDVYHDAIKPLMGAYIFDQNGEFNSIVKLEFKDQHGISYGLSTIEKITKNYKRAVCFLLHCETKNILIYSGGEKAAEICISETTGRWRFRYPNEIFGKMTSLKPNINPDILKYICNACLELSFRGQGTIIVVGDIKDDIFNLSRPKIQYTSECNIRDLGIDYFIEFAKMDGAIFISSDGYIKKVNRNVTVTKAVELKPLFPGKGLRHETGEKISKVSPEALVVIVSENRGISIIHPGGDEVDSDL